MATGESYASTTAGNEIFYDWRCKTCEENDFMAEAVAYCKDCKECYCVSCLREHNKFVSLRGHSVLGQTDKDNWGKSNISPVVSKESEIECSEHKGQSISMYCGNHDDVCCPVCAFMNHGDVCKPKMTFIPSVAKGIGSSSELKDLMTTNKQLLSQIEQIEKKKSEGLAVVSTSRKKCRKKVSDICQKYIAGIKKLERISITNVNKKHDDEEKNIQRDIDQCAEERLLLYGVKKQMQAKHPINDSALFIKLKAGQKCHQRCKEVCESLSSRQMKTFEFHEDPDILQASLPKTFGECRESIPKMEHQRSETTESKTYEIVAERVSKIEQDRFNSPSTYFSHKLTLDDDYSFRASAALEDSINSRLTKSPKNRSHSSAASSGRDDTGSQHAKVSSSRDNAATASSPRPGTSGSIRSPAAGSPHDSWETNFGTPKLVSQEAVRYEQRYSSLPADRAGLYARSNIHMQDNYTDDQMSCTFDIAGVKVIVCKGDHTKEVTEAIVNSANQELVHYGGVAGALSRARGPEMQTESRAHIRKNGPLKVTDVMHTSGGGEIKATHIMHAAGPMWLEWGKEECICQMAQTFLNCFNYANTKLRVKSIALPAISTGVYGAPLDECVRCFLLAILVFVNGQQRGSLRLQEIRLVNNDPEATVTSIVLLQTLMVEGIESLTRQAEELFQTGDAKEIRLNLPKGRPARSESFLTTYSVTKEPVIQKTNATRSKASARRSSSLSRVPDKQKYGKDVYDSRQEERVSSGRSSSYSGRSSPYDHKSGSMSDRGRERTRTSSMTSATKSSVDRNARKATGLSRTSSTSSVTSASTPNIDRDARGGTGRSRTSSVKSPVTSSRDRDTRGASAISTHSYRASSKPTTPSSRSNT